MRLELSAVSWQNLFNTIRAQDPPIGSEGNFWAAIQHLERQFEEKKEFIKLFKETPAGLCIYCGEKIAIRNPTGKCDHLYYPANANKNYKDEVNKE